MLTNKFKDLLNELRYYYPSDISNSDPDYQNTQEIIRLNDSIRAKNSYEYQSKWEKFIKQMSSELNYNVSCKNSIQDPSLTGEVLILEEMTESFLFKRIISFHVSSIGKYYSIYGREIVTKHCGNEHLYFDPIITVSPKFPFEECFYKVNSFILRVYQDYEFLNMTLLGSYAEGISTPTTSNMFSQINIFQAFFSSENVPQYRRKGKLNFTFKS